MCCSGLSSVAQRKRAGPITQRSVDRNNPKLFIFTYFTHAFNRALFIFLM